MSISVWLRNPDLKRAALLDDFDKLSLVINFADLSKWSIDLPNLPTLSAVTWGWGIIVESAGEVILSGPLTHLSRSNDGAHDRLVLSGLDDTVLLRDRLAYPCAEPWTATDTDDRTGPGESVLKAYVAANAGPDAAVGRAIPGLTIEPDAAGGVTVSGSARFDNLFTLVQSLAVSAGRLGFRVIQVGDGREFQTFIPQDRSLITSGFHTWADAATFATWADLEAAYGTWAEVEYSASLDASGKLMPLFSPSRGSLSKYDYAVDRPTGNFFIGAGQGVGTERMFVVRQDADSAATYGRVESFVDQRQTNDVPTIVAKLNEGIAQQGFSESATLVLLDTDALRFGRDYAVGDIVAVEFDGFRIVDVLVQANVTIDDKGVVVAPVLGSQGAQRSGLPDFFRRQRDIEQRVSSLEARL